MGNFLKFNDLVQFSLLDPNLVKVKDDYEGAFKPDGGEQTHHTGMGTVATQQQQQQQSQEPQKQTGLNVRIAATHSGIITRNNGFYLPDKMKKGADTFVEDFGKPILLHHNDKEDSIGRIIQSHYVDTSGAVADKYNGLVVRNRYGDEVGTIKDSLIKDFVSDRMPFGQQVDVICSLLKDSLLEDSNYQGLGHIQVVANISDQVAIQKLLDGRYLTGSVGATTNKAVCSVCKSDWTKGGPCDHKPGGVYDDAKCFIIAGELIYDEYSFVNVPADRHSRVLELHYNGIQDNIEIANDYKGRIYEVRLEFPQYDSVNKEDKGMTVNKDGKDVTVVLDSANPAPDAEPAEGTGDVVVEDTLLTSDDKGDTTVVAPVTDETVVVEESIEESIEDFVVRVLNSTDELSDEDRNKAYQVLWDNVVTDDELLKLTDEKRKAMAKSQFCTDKLLFPVHDAAHLVAAYKLLSSVKLSDEVKEEIFSTLNRKAKVQGVKLTDDVESTSEKTEDNHTRARMMHGILGLMEENMWDTENPVLDEDEQNMLRSVLKRLSGLVGKDAFITAIVGEGIMNDEKALMDEVVKSEETIGDLQDRLDATRKEYANLYQDLEGLQDSLVEEKSKTRKVQENYLSTLKTLRDSKVDEELNWTSLTDEGVTAELSRLTDEVDMVKITDKLGDGLSRIPVGDIDDPTVIQDSSDPSNKKVSLASVEQIQENYYMILFRDGAIRADEYIEQLRIQGKLPQSFENIQGGSN